MDIFQKAYSGFDNILNNYVLETAGKICEAISPAAYTMMAIYFVLWGFLMIRNMVDEPVTDGLFRVLKITLILSFALNVGRYGEWIVNFCINTPEALASKISLDHPMQEANIGKTADLLVNKVMATSKVIWAQAGVMNGNVGHYFIAIILGLLGLLMAGLGFIFYLTAKLGLVFSLAVGPLFVLMLIFKPMQRFFESWVTLVVGFMMQIIFILSSVGFGFYMFEKVADRAAKLVTMNQLLEAPVQLSAAALLGIALLFMAKAMATHVSGGFSISLGEVSRRASHATRAANVATKLAAAKATGGASLAISAGKAAGQLFRASNAIRRN